MCAPTPRSHHFGGRLGPLEGPPDPSDWEAMESSTTMAAREPVDLRAETERAYIKYIGKWGPNFSRTLDITDYKGWKNTSEAVDSVLHFNKGAMVLDLQSGPGRLGEKLKEYGFTNIDAIEGNPRMLEVAAKRGVYQNLIQCVVGLEEISIAENTYDCVMTCGSFHEHNLDHTIIPDIVKWIKPGGFMVLNISTEAYKSEYLKQLGPTLSALNASGKIRFVVLDKRSNYGCVDSVIVTFRVM
ncbi:uncharacterized protein LOC135485146 [Lineus longissimus]|uniref:uncharacterized protein LOC135485146 n=1 Tax=Lineus longissimus TaxID=88925 RepID=UPI002B4DE846